VKHATKTYGTVSPEQQKAMSGLEFVKGLASGVLPLNTFAQTLGYDVVEAESRRVAITLDPTGARGSRRVRLSFHSRWTSRSLL
jgi:hypothetical protein